MSDNEEENSSLLVTFGLGGAWYGLEASQVQEVILVTDNTVVYHAPAYVRGIINLRGKIVTVLDLEAKLGLEKQAETAFQEAGSGHTAALIAEERILIVDWSHEQVGLLVEMVSDVISLNYAQIETVPLNISEDLSRFLSGVYSSQDRLIGILDLEKVLAE